jgi:hypothetical protein
MMQLQSFMWMLKIFCWGLLVLWYSINHLIMQATMLQEMLACESQNTGG